MPEPHPSVARDDVDLLSDLPEENPEADAVISSDPAPVAAAADPDPEAVLDLDVDAESPDTEPGVVELGESDFFDDHLLGAGTEVPPDPELDAETAAAKHRRKRRYVLVSAGAAVLVLGGIFGPLGYQYVSQRNASLATPDQVAGLTLDRDSDAQATADYLRTAVAASVSLNNSVGAVYANPADTSHSVLFFGGTGTLTSPDQDLSVVFKLLDDQGSSMKDVHTVPAGHFGGEMKCGVSTGEGGDMTVCGWADHGSIAVALFPGRSVDEGATLMVKMRDGIQRRT